MNTSMSRCLVVAAWATASGCTSLSGIDGSSTYACKAPDGVKCDSVSGTYYNALQNNLPSQRDGRKPLGSPTPATPATPPSAQSAVQQVALTPSPLAGPGPAMPLRSGPQVLRLWIKPWEDSDHDLNGESVVYVKIDNGRWMVDHVQRRAVEAFAPVRPGRQVSPLRAAPAATASAEPRSPQSDAAAIAETLRALQQQRPATPPPADN